MGTYVVTGSVSGIGAAAAELLRSEGHSVLGVDLRETDSGADLGRHIVADLGTDEGRAYAVAEILRLSGGVLDGVAAIAGVGPDMPDPAAVVSIDYFGPVALLVGLRPALARAGAPRAVVIGSNSATTVPMIDERLVEHALAGDEAAARETALATQRATAKEIIELAPSISAYASAKFALARWVRRTAVTPGWARHGILLNAIAPGAVLTPLMLSSTGATPDMDIAEFPTPMPLGAFGKPSDIAFWVYQFLRPEARFTTGAVLFVDGGTDAAMRPESQPSAWNL